MQLTLQLVLQDYRVHIKHTDGTFEYVPYFSLPANDLTEVIAPSCYSCFDYPNALADLVRKHRQPGWCVSWLLTRSLRPQCRACLPHWLLQCWQLRVSHIS